MDLNHNQLEELARRAFLHYHGYPAAPQDWDRLPITRQKWVDLVQFLTRELNFSENQQLIKD